MVISVECSNCGQAYQVEDRLAGKKVRCKQCGHAFLVEPEGVGQGPGEGLPLAAQGSDDAADEGDVLLEGPVLVRRGWNPPYRFPMARGLDRALPVALFLGGLGWIGAATLDFNGPQKWIGVVHAAVLLGVVVGVVMPLINLGYRVAGRKAGFAPPPHSRFRAIASAAVPVAIIYTFWSIDGNIGAMLLGAGFGVVLFAGASWLFLRLRPGQAGVALVWVGGCFAVSVVLGVVLIGVLHHATLGLMQSMHRTGAVKESPVARGF